MSGSFRGDVVSSGRKAWQYGRRGLTRPSQRPAARIWSTGCSPPRPDVAWCGDMTEIVTGEGKLYLATVTDLYSRRILGFAMGAQHDAHWSSPR